MIATQDEAHKLHSCGLPITLCPQDSKKPLGDGWTAKYNGTGWPCKSWTPHEIDRAFEERGELNVGVLLGPKSGLIDIEEDSLDDRATFNELFSDCEPPVTAAFDSPRGRHRFYTWHPELETVGKATAHYNGLEIKIGANGKGAHSLFPPSTSNGGSRHWLVPLDDCPAAHLPESVRQKIIEASTKPIPHSGMVNRETEDTENIASVSLLTLSLCKPQHEAVADAIKLTVPSGPGHRNRAVFNYARRLKAIPSLADAEVGSLRPFVEEWHRAARPYIGTMGFDESWADFVISWGSVKFSAGQGPIRMIYSTALTKPVPPAGERYGTDSLRRLVMLCCELQRIAGAEPFYLTCRTAGELLGISHVMANKWLRVLAADDVLQVVKQGTQGHASRYRYIGD